MGERSPNDRQLETMFADYQRLKEEMPHYAGFSAKTESRYRSSRGGARHLRQRRMPQQRRICTMPVSMSTQAKTQRSPCSVVCSVDGRMCMPFECDSRMVSGVMYQRRFATGKQSFRRILPFERRSTRRPGSCCL